LTRSGWRFKVLVCLIGRPSFIAGKLPFSFGSGDCECLLGQKVVQSLPFAIALLCGGLMRIAGFESLHLISGSSLPFR
jgi:hypothetical protein